MTPHFWQDKKVLITGHTGFKGSWLSIWLQQLGADVLGIALEPATNPSLFDVANVAEGMQSHIIDINDLVAVKQVFHAFQPDIVFHMAAQALVRESYDNPVETYQTNVMGSLNILEAIRSCESVKSAIMVTTDKCYDNKEWRWPYRESDELGGHDPYSSSKACAELLIDSYRRSFFAKPDSTAIASVRAGNVIGGGDWSNDRLIPDIVRAKKNQTPLVLRYPEAIRPWQHVLEPVNGYLLLAENLFNHGNKFAQAWNFGPTEQGLKSVESIVDYFSQKWPAFDWQLEAQSQPHEALTLKLDCTKAHELLGWQAKWSLTDSLDNIESWYQRFDDGEDMKQVCIEQIQSYMKCLTQHVES